MFKKNRLLKIVSIILLSTSNLNLFCAAIPKIESSILTPQDAFSQNRQRIMEIIQELAPELHEKITNLDKDGSSHIVTSNGYAAIECITSDGLPILHLGNAFMNLQDKAIQKAIIAHELGHYILQHSATKQSTYHASNDKILPNKQSPQVKTGVAKVKISKKALDPNKAMTDAYVRTYEYEADAAVMKLFGLSLTDAQAMVKSFNDSTAGCTTFSIDHPKDENRLKQFESIDDELTRQNKKNTDDTYKTKTINWNQIQYDTIKSYYGAANKKFIRSIEKYLPEMESNADNDFEKANNDFEKTNPYKASSETSSKKYNAKGQKTSETLFHENGMKRLERLYSDYGTSNLSESSQIVYDTLGYKTSEIKYFAPKNSLYDYGNMSSETLYKNGIIKSNWEYDANEHPIKLTIYNAKGQKTSEETYDAHRNVTSKTLTLYNASDYKTSEKTYDAHGNVTSETLYAKLYNRLASKKEYDAHGKLTSETLYDRYGKKTSVNKSDDSTSTNEYYQDDKIRLSVIRDTDSDRLLSDTQFLADGNRKITHYDANEEEISKEIQDKEGKVISKSPTVEAVESPIELPEIDSPSKISMGQGIKEVDNENNKPVLNEIAGNKIIMGEVTKPHLVSTLHPVDQPIKLTSENHPPLGTELIPHPVAQNHTMIQPKMISAE